MHIWHHLIKHRCAKNKRPSTVESYLEVHVSGSDDEATAMTRNGKQAATLMRHTAMVT